MPSYPPYKISTPDESLNILQITDMHLSTYDPNASDGSTGQYDCQHSFEAVIKQALAEDMRCDLILVTGDLVSEVQPAIYDYIFEVLKATNIPFVCIAGNHDVTDERGSERPFFQRELIPRPADSRLLNHHVLESDYWQILLLDSAIPGKVAGEITRAHLDWLCEQLTQCTKPAIIALHHHVMPMDSEWIDEHIAENAEGFWQRLEPFLHLRVVTSGHTHQERVAHYKGVTVYNTPSTCYQFKPLEDDFALDDNALPGYRWLQLANNGQVASWVKRLDT